jgi:arsenate reductase
MTPPTRRRVLFLCLGNACRSPMAESIARHRAPDIIEPSSAGLYPLGYIVDQTRQTLIANGYPVDELSSKPLRRELLNDTDLVINMSGLPADRVFGEPANVEEWIVEDPYGQDPATYQRILEVIEARVLSLASRLRAVQSKDEL